MTFTWSSEHSKCELEPYWLGSPSVTLSCQREGRHVGSEVFIHTSMTRNWSISHDLGLAFRVSQIKPRRLLGSSHEVFSPYSAKRLESTALGFASPDTGHFQAFSAS